MRPLARVPIAASTPVLVFRRDWVPSQISSQCGVLYSPTGLEHLTDDVVAVSLASGDDYRATLDDGSTGGVYPLPGVIRPRAAGVCLTSAASREREVVETGTVDTPLVVCSSAFRDR